MEARDLRALILWADTAPDNATFWSRLWCAAEAYDTRTRINIQAMCVNVGGFALDNTDEKAYNGSVARKSATGS